MSFGASSFGAAAFGGGAATGDGLGPVISSVTPSVGSEIARFEPFEFNVGDDDGLKFITVTVKFFHIDDPMLVYDDEGFHGRFLSGSVYTANTGNLLDPSHFSIIPDGGWFGTVEEIKVNALDIFGAKSGIDI